MTKPSRYILNAEQISAHREAARLRNPNAKEIESLRAEIAALSARISGLISEDEKYLNILSALSEDFDSRTAAVKCMEDAEIADHLGELFFEHTRTEVDEAILTEAMTRLGWAAEEDNA